MVNFSKLSKLYDFIPTVETKEFLPSPNRWFNIASTLLVTTFIGSVSVAAVLKYDDVINATATIRPSGELSSIQSTTEGVIESVHIVENMSVKKGDLIAIIVNPKFDIQKKLIMGNNQKLIWQINQVDAQIRSVNSQRIAQVERTNRGVISARLELQRRSREHQTKLISNQSDLDESEANLQIAEKNLQQGQIELQSRQSALEAAISKQNRYRTLIDSGAIEQDKVDEVELIANQRSQAVAEQKKELEQRLQVIASARAKIRRSKSNLNPNNADLSIASELIAQERASGTIALAQLDKEIQALNQQRLQIEQQIQSNRQQITEIEHQLRQKTISAPINGIVLKVNVRDPKQPVTLGTEIAQIIPINSKLIVKAAVNAQDIGKVKPKQKTILQISAYPYPDYGTLKGEVVSIAPDSTDTPNANPLLDPKAAIAKTYQVTILPEYPYLLKNGQKYLLKPGMESKVQIVTAEETVLTFLLRKIRLMSNI